MAGPSHAPVRRLSELGADVPDRSAVAEDVPSRGIDGHPAGIDPQAVRPYPDRQPLEDGRDRAVGEERDGPRTAAVEAQDLAVAGERLQQPAIDPPDDGAVPLHEGHQILAVDLVMEHSGVPLRAVDGHIGPRPKRLAVRVAARPGGERRGQEQGDANSERDQYRRDRNGLEFESGLHGGHLLRVETSCRSVCLAPPANTVENTGLWPAARGGGFLWG